MLHRIFHTIRARLDITGSRSIRIELPSPATPHARGRASARMIEMEPTNVAQLRHWLPDELKHAEPDERFIETAKHVLNARVVQAVASIEARTQGHSDEIPASGTHDKAAILKESKSIIDSFLKRQTKRWEDHVMIRQYLHPDTHSNEIKLLDVELMRASYEDIRQTLAEIDAMCPPPAYSTTLESACPSYAEAMNHPRAMRRKDS